MERNHLAHIELTQSEWMALCSLIAEHLRCPAVPREYLNCSSNPVVRTTPEKLLAIAMNPQWVKA